MSVALSPEVANEFAFLAAHKSGGAPAVMPLLHRTERPAVLHLDGTEKNLEVASTLNDAFHAGGRDAVVMTNYTTPGGNTGQNIVVGSSAYAEIYPGRPTCTIEGYGLLRLRGDLPALFAK